MAISAADVKKLRDLTGAGMMDCKKALEEAEGDFDSAVEVLRVKGQAKAAKRGSEREASNGLVAHRGNAMIQLACETDFVAKNEDFQALADEIAAIADSGKINDLESLLAAPHGAATVGTSVAEIAARIGEKIELADVAYFEGAVAAYLHKKAADLPAQVGVLLAYTGDEAAARGAAMQVAAMRAQYLVREEIPAEMLENEARIAEATAREEGKSEAALPKITEGRVNGFVKEVTLLEQDSVTDSKKKVKAVLEEAGTTVSAFKRFGVGSF